MSLWQKIKNIFGGTPEEQPQEIHSPSAPNRTKAASRPRATEEATPVRKNEHSNASTTGKIPISYDPNLIGQLQDDHQTLLREFTQVNFLASDDQFENALTALVKFRSKLLNHLHLENLKLYVYLQYSLTDKPEGYAQMRAFRKEMDAIGKVALDFFDRYEKEGLSAENKNEFLIDLSKIGNVLSKRIQQEEERLYTMYRDLA